jgi:hypothetical protein
MGHSGDVFQRVILFWGLFLPLGEVWSIDATIKSWKKKFKPEKRNTYSHLSVAGVALLIHVINVYTTSYYHKTGKEWLVDHTAVFYALQLDYFQMPLARFLLTLPEGMLKIMCVVTLFWEHYGGFFLLIPIKNDYWRILGVLGFWGMHLGFGLCLRLGLFYWITTALFFAFIPPLFWDRIFFPWIRTKERLGITVYYNSETGFSRNLAFFLKCFMLEETIFLPINKYDSELIINNEKIHPVSHTEDSITIPIEESPTLTSFPKNHNTWLLVSASNPFPNQYRGTEALLLCFNSTPVLRILGFIGKRLPKKVLTGLQSWADLANLMSESPRYCTIYRFTV